MVVQKQKKKKWYQIYAPDLFRGQVIGESLASDPNMLMGKRLSVNLMNLTDDPKKQNFRLVFKIVKIDGDKALTEIIAYEMLLTHVKRMMRKGVEKIEDSFVVQSKDNVNIRLKPLLLIRNKVNHSVSTAIRKKDQEVMSDEAKKQDYSDILRSIITNKLQKQSREALTKIYPLAACELRIVERL